MYIMGECIANRIDYSISCFCFLFFSTFFSKRHISFGKQSKSINDIDILDMEELSYHYKTSNILVFLMLHNKTISKSNYFKRRTNNY